MGINPRTQDLDKFLPCCFSQWHVMQSVYRPQRVIVENRSLRRLLHSAIP